LLKRSYGRLVSFSHHSMHQYTPPVIITPLPAQPVGPQPAVQAAVNPRHVVNARILGHIQLTVNHSLLAVPSPMAVQQQIPQYMPTTRTAPIPIPARSSAQPVSYGQQPSYPAQSFPMYAQQSQLAGYPMPGYGYGTPATTQYIPSSAGGSHTYVSDRPASPHRHRHHHLFGHHHHHCLFHHRDRTYSDPEYDYRYRRH